MKQQPNTSTAAQPGKKRPAKFASAADFLAEKDRQFQQVFGKVDWEKAKQDGLIS